MLAGAVRARGPMWLFFVSFATASGGVASLARIGAWAGVLAAGAAGGATLTGCKDTAKESAKRAEEHARWLVDLASKDVAELERGLPEGATKMAALYAGGADPKVDPQAVQVALRKTRRDVRDLAIAKSTFFALADDKGVAIRNDLDQDVMAGQNLSAAFPGLAKATEGPVKVLGAFAGVADDRDWMYAVPVREGGKTVGVYLSGWTYRAFARHLKLAFDLELKDRQGKGTEASKTPLLYVMVFDATGAYGAPLTPKINEAAVSERHLLDKTAQGPFQDVVEIDGRNFGLGAARVPAMAPDIGIAVLRSEL